MKEKAQKITAGQLSKILTDSRLQDSWDDSSIFLSLNYLGVTLHEVRNIIGSSEIGDQIKKISKRFEVLLRSKGIEIIDSTKIEDSQDFYESLN